MAIGKIIRDTYDWVPIIFDIITFCMIVYTIYVRSKNKEKMRENDFTYYMKSQVCIPIMITLILGCFMIGYVNYDRHKDIDQYELGLKYEEEENWELSYQSFMNVSTNWNDEIENNLMQHVYYVYSRMEYEHGIEELEKENWMSAYICFSEAMDYLDASILADYCYYMYLNETYPDWTPFMHIPYLGG